MVYIFHLSIGGTSEGSASMTPSTGVSLEAQLPTSSAPLFAGGTTVTSLQQPLADKLMWSPSTPATTKKDSTAGEATEIAGPVS